MHKPHVVPFWAMDWPEDWIRDYLVRQNEDPARSPLLGFVDDMAVGYIEVYDPARDVLGAHAPILPGDIGAHVLIGDEEHLGRYCVAHRPRRRALPVQAPRRAADRRRARRAQPPVPLAARVPRVPQARARSTCRTSARRSWSASARTSSGSPAAAGGSPREPRARRASSSATATRAALDGVDLSVRRAECVALLGPNGAGKRRWSRSPRGCSDAGRPGAVSVRGRPRPGAAGDRRSTRR